jgi:gamma-glutamyltranspeptidase/glutathione hydrolase/leukotriene-C4 hydrolase
MDASAAVEYGRAHDQLYPQRVDVDDILPALFIEGLRERGHNVTGSFDAILRPCPRCPFPLTYCV